MAIAQTLPEVYVRPQRWVKAGHAMDVRAVTDWAVRAEQLGFTGIFMGDRLLGEATLESQTVYGASGVDPLLMLSAIAAITTRLKLGTLIYVVPYRHPIQIAKTVASLDTISAGRVVFGAGLGWNRREFETLGLEMQGRGARFEEALEVLRRLWAGGAVAHDGPTWHFNDVEITPNVAQPTGPPIWMASFAPSHSLDFSEGFEPPVARALDRIGRLADAWVPLTYSASAKRRISPRDLARAWDTIRESAAAVGRPDGSVQMIQSDWIYVLDGPGAKERCQDGLATFFSGSWEDAQATYLIGTADEVVEKLRRQSELIDRVGGYVLTPLTSEPAQLELFAERIAPALRSGATPTNDEGAIR